MLSALLLAACSSATNRVADTTRSSAGSAATLQNGGSAGAGSNTGEAGARAPGGAGGTAGTPEPSASGGAAAAPDVPFAVAVCEGGARLSVRYPDGSSWLCCAAPLPACTQVL